MDWAIMIIVAKIYTIYEVALCMVVLFTKGSHILQEIILKKDYIVFKIVYIKT